LGPESIHVAQTLNKIGNVYYEARKYDKALEQYEKCLKI
jgi:hypothetical protein